MLSNFGDIEKTFGARIFHCRLVLYHAGLCEMACCQYPRALWEKVSWCL